MGTEIVREISWEDPLPRTKIPSPKEIQTLVHGFFNMAKHKGSVVLTGFLLVQFPGKPHNPFTEVDDKAKPPLSEERYIIVLVAGDLDAVRTVQVETWRADQYIECLADGFAKMIAEYYGAHYKDNRKEVAAAIKEEHDQGH